MEIIFKLVITPLSKTMIKLNKEKELGMEK